MFLKLSVNLDDELVSERGGSKLEVELPRLGPLASGDKSPLRSRDEGREP